MGKNTSVMGIYPDRTTVYEAVSVLYKVGYRATDISVLSSDNQGSKDFGHEKQTKAGLGAAVGAAVVAVIGAAAAWYATTHTVPVKGVEALVAAGPVLATLAGAGAGGVLGWILGFLVGLTGTQYVAKRYAGRIRHGGILLSVHCDSPEWCARARKTLKNTGAQCISSAAESSADYGTTDKPTERAPVAVMDRVEAPTPAPASPATEYVVRESKP